MSKNFLLVFLIISLIFSTINIPVSAAKSINESNQTVIKLKNETKSNIQVKSNQKVASNSKDKEVRLFYIESLYDIGCLTMSLKEFLSKPKFSTGFWVIADGASVIFPGVPAVSGVKRMIDSSSTLEKSLKVGVLKYGNMKNKKIPKGWERHHIFEKRFQPALKGATTNNMLAIAIPKDKHKLITQKLRKKVPYGTNYKKMKTKEVIDIHIQAYRELYEATKDPYWEFLYKFTKSRQYKG